MDVSSQGKMQIKSLSLKRSARRLVTNVQTNLTMIIQICVFIHICMEVISYPLYLSFRKQAY